MLYSYDKAGNLVYSGPEQSPAPPQIVGHSGTRIVPVGGTVTLSVVVADARGVTFQWWGPNGQDLPGETRDTLRLTNVTAAMEGGYSVEAMSAGGSAAFWPPPSIFVDTTGNLLPDSWQIAHFGNLTSQRAAGDPDQDGISNLDEFLDGTDPLSSASQRPRLVAYSDVGGSVFANPTQLSYSLGDTVTLRATAFQSYEFVGWDGDVQAGTDQLQMTSSKKVRAKMIKV
jgi:hypothetical protein